MKKILLSSLFTFILFFVWGLIGSFVIEDFSYFNWKTHVWWVEFIKDKEAYQL